MPDSWFGRLAAAAWPVFLLVAPVRAADEQAGVLWETTSRTVMEGMPYAMPAQTTKVCAAREWTRPPAGGGGNCTSSDFRKVGPKASWSVRCTGDMEMSGVGEMTFDGTDSYTGTIRFTSAEMNMTVKLSGRRIGGCDTPL